MNKAAVGLLALGLLQMTGDLVERFVTAPAGRALKGLGSASAASPAPKVFSSVKGLETYSTRFFIEWTDWDGEPHSLQLTPEVNARLQGPYNRRNVYGAVLAYGPILEKDARTRPMFTSVVRYALCDKAPVLRELGIDPGGVKEGSLRVHLEPLPGTSLGDLNGVLEVPCP
jgi:hypothetical protein